jgi:amino acid adenylation domain-containing protein
MSAHVDGSNRNITFSPFEKKDLEQAVCARFEEQVRKYPNRTAVRTRDVALTYSALNQEANRIARAIVNRCGTEQQQVAHLVTDDAQSVAAILGILKAGKIFVTLDPRHPHARNLQLVNHAEATLVVTDSDNLEAARALCGAGEPLNIDAIPSSVCHENLGLAVPPEALGCIIYTSGSTGQPKGVLHSQRNLLAWGLIYGYGLRISPADRVCVVSARTSGQSIVIIFSALLNGASACLFPLREEEPRLLSSWLIEEEITIYHSTPSIFRSLVQTLSGEERFPRLRVLRLGGEMVSAQDLELYKKHFSPNCVFVNSLGATEAGPFREFFADHDTVISENVVPSGYPAWGMDVLLLDDEGRAVEAGCVGEIAVRSDYLAVSYWRQPDLTRAAFLPDPTGSGARVYRTGDLGRLSPEGCLYCLGRKDRQVKIRGNRVELADVEMTLRTIEGVQDAAVSVRQNEQGEPFLVAYVVAATKPGPSTISVRADLRRLLPDCMVPSVFVMLDSIPMTSHGKVDRGALPEPRLKRTYVPPRNAVETLICELWEQILGVRPVGIRDDFLELGGNSLRAARLMTHIELHFGRRIPRSTLLSAATVEELARVIPERPDGELASPLVRMQAGGNSRKPFFFLHGQFSGWGFYCKALAPLLGQEQPFYVLHPLTPGDDLPATVELMAKYYLQVLRDAQPHGPYLLGGYCNAGLIALEMAQELRAQGEKVELLVLVETLARNHEFRVQRKLVSLAARFLKISPGDELEYFLRLCRVSTHFRSLSSLQRAKFLVRKTRALPRVAKWVNRRLWQRSSPNAAPPQPQNVTARPDGWEQEKVEAHYRRLVFGYAPRPYAGRLTIFRACDEKRLTDDPALGWRSLAQDVDPHMIRGDHNGCIDLAENLPIFAKHLKSCLDACHAASRYPDKTREGELLLDWSE